MKLQRRNLRRALALCIGSCIALGIGEGALRAVLFGGWSIGWSLRTPGRYADYQSDEDFYKLEKRWRGGQMSVPDGLRHPRIGWIPGALEPTTLLHRSESSSEADGRRRVLLYGDSYARCMTPRGTRFEDVFNRSPLAASHRLLNYGAAGYGLDQVALLIEETIDDHSESSPVVLVGVFVDDDLDRCTMQLRWHPKPRFRLDRGALVLEGTPVPTFTEYLDRHPLRIRSYLARLLVPKGLQSRLAGQASREQEAAALARALVRRIHAELETHGLEPVFVLFEGEARTAAETQIVDWRLEALLDSLDDLAIPHVRTRGVIREAATASGRSVHEFFGQVGGVSNHFNERGNGAAARAILDAVEGRFEPGG